MRSEVQVLLDPPFALRLREAASAKGQRAARHKDGALAQLGERLICIQEVIGSIPIGSTSIPGRLHMIIKRVFGRV